MAKKLLIHSLLIIVVLFTNCDDDTSIPPDNGSGLPVVVNTEDVYTYTLLAGNYSETRNNTLDFTSDLLTISLTIVGYQQGNGALTVLAADSSVIFTESLDANKVITLTDLSGAIPSEINIEINNLSATLTFTLTTQ